MNLEFSCNYDLTGGGNNYKRKNKERANSKILI